MALVTGDKIVKQEVINYFSQNVLNFIKSGIVYHSGNVPKFPYNSAAVNYNSRNVMGEPSVPVSPVLNPSNAIPSGQLDSIPNSIISIPDQKIIAQTVYDVLYSIVKDLTRIMNTYYRWYHQTNNTKNLISELSGKTVFLKTTATIPNPPTWTVPRNLHFNTPTPPVTAPAYYVKTVYVGSTPLGNNTNMVWDELTVNNAGVQKGLKATALSINTFMNNLKTAFTNLYNTRTSEFKYYTCHNNCHVNCYNNRARR